MPWKLFEPIRINEIWIRNRIVMPPMATNLASHTGEATDALIKYYAERARGGAGLVIVEASYVHRLGRGFSAQLGIYDDQLVPRLSMLANAIKSFGACAAIQLFHAGIYASEKLIGESPVGPSEHPKRGARELSVQEIEELVKAFGEAAHRAKRAGFDAVEIHGTHGYLIHQFLSPRTNRRTDSYGGSFENRCRFALEVVDEIRKSVGSGYPILFRICAEEYVSGGISVEEGVEFSKKLDKAGVDAIHVSAGAHESAYMFLQPMYLSRGCLLRLARAVRAMVNVPVIAVGRINDPLLAEEALHKGWADMIAMGRALIADPELPKKVAEGRLEDVRKCIACLEGCIGRLVRDLPIRCAVNPVAGLEHLVTLEKAEKAKKVVVVGAGPAGLEAARVAALRGHEVVVVEKEGVIGGALRAASVPEFKLEIREVVRWYASQLAKLGVKLELGKEASADYILSLQPDVVVIATGAESAKLEIPGGENAASAEDVLLGRKQLRGYRVAVVGGGLIGCEVAVHLAEKGKRVTVLSRSPDIAKDTVGVVRMAVWKLLRQRGVEVLTNVAAEEIQRNGVVAVDRSTGEKVFVEADDVVAAVGREPKPKLADEIWGRVREVYVVGDARKAGRILDAVHQGFAVGARI